MRSILPHELRKTFYEKWKVGGRVLMNASPELGDLILMHKEDGSPNERFLAWAEDEASVLGGKFIHEDDVPLNRQGVMVDSK